MKALKHQAFVFLYRMIQRYPEMAILNKLGPNGASRNFHFMSAFVVDSYSFLVNYGWALVGFSAWCTWKSRASSYCPASQVPNMCLFEMMCQFFEKIWLLVDCILTFLAGLKRFCWANPDFRGVIFPNFLHAVYEVVSNEIDPKAGVSFAHSHGSHGPCSFMMYLWRTMDFS